MTTELTAGSQPSIRTGREDSTIGPDEYGVVVTLSESGSESTRPGPRQTNRTRFSKSGQREQKLVASVPTRGSVPPQSSAAAVAGPD